MRVFDEFTNKNIDELAEWLDTHCVPDFSPWIKWFDDNYCKKCESIIATDTVLGFEREMEFGWCELHGDRCKYFQDKEYAPYGKELVKMWLESEA